MASGVAVKDECNTVFNEIKKAKKHRYAIFMIRDEKEIIVEKVADNDATYEDFLRDLTIGGETECRYALYDMEYTFNPQGAEPSKKSKMFLMSWCPDTAKIKKKMLYSSSFDSLKKAFVGVHKIIQANDISEASAEAVEDILRSTDRN